MGLKKASKGSLFYHLTDIANLPSIIQNGLLSRNRLLKCGDLFQDVANPDIISKRGDLNNYIPFHFHPYTAFDIAVKHTYQNKIFIYLCLSRKLAERKGFFILPMHPLSEHDFYPNPLSYQEGYNAINWNYMTKKESEFATDEDRRKAKQIKMAECLVPDRLDIDDIMSIGVPSETIKNRVISIFHSMHHRHVPHVNILEEWFKR